MMTRSRVMQTHVVSKDDIHQDVQRYHDRLWSRGRGEPVDIDADMWELFAAPDAASVVA